MCCRSRYCIGFVLSFSSLVIPAMISTFYIFNLFQASSLWQKSTSQLENLSSGLSFPFFILRKFYQFCVKVSCWQSQWFKPRLYFLIDHPTPFDKNKILFPCKRWHFSVCKKPGSQNLIDSTRLDKFVLPYFLYF